MPPMRYDDESDHYKLTFKDMEKPLNLPLEDLQSYLQQDKIKFYSIENSKWMERTFRQQ